MCHSVAHSSNPQQGGPKSSVPASSKSARAPNPHSLTTQPGQSLFQSDLACFRRATESQLQGFDRRPASSAGYLNWQLSGQDPAGERGAPRINVPSLKYTAERDPIRDCIVQNAANGLSSAKYLYFHQLKLSLDFVSHSTAQPLGRRRETKPPDSHGCRVATAVNQ